MWQRLKYEWKKQLTFKLAIIYLLALLLLAVFAPLFTTGLPPDRLHLAQAYQPPFDLNSKNLETEHWLGTDQLGRDVWANLLYGCRTAFSVALPVMLLALFSGTSLGMAAAWFGNRKLRFNFATGISFIFWIFCAWFYVLYLPVPAGAQNAEFQKADLIGLLWLAGITLLTFILRRLLKTVSFMAEKVRLPFDEVLLKLKEVLSSVPRLILVLTFAALISPGIGNVILLLSLTYWIGPARLARAETLKIKQLPYIEAAQAAGLPAWRILYRHVLPNASGPLITAFCFGLSGLLGLEATLSFLGIGLPPETPSWGRMLAGARLNPEAWWLVVFPAAVLCVTILAIQAVGQGFRKIFETNR